MDHTPAHDTYYADEIWQDSPLTTDDRERFRDAIRTLILDITEEIELTEFEHDAIRGMYLVKFDGHDDLSISLYLDNADFNTPPTPNALHDDNLNHISTQDPDYLRDLGHTWNALEYDIISELVILLDLPESTDELTPYVCFSDQDTPNLTATTGYPDFTTFYISTHIPQTTQTIYANADFDTANQLGIPIEK